MTEYIISLLERKHSVFILPANGRISECIASDGVAIVPDSVSPYDVTVQALGTRSYREWELRMLLGFFYRSLLGYPLCELSVAVDGVPMTLEIFDTPHGFAGLCVNRCKLLYTSVYTAPDLTEHTLYTVLSGGIYRVLRVKNSDTFRPEILSTLRTVRGLPTASSAIALSNEKIILNAGEKISPYALTAAALASTSDGEGGVSLTYGETKFSVLLNGDSSTVLAPASLLKINKI